MKSKLNLKNCRVVVLLCFLALSACDNNDPVAEPIPETITEVTLAFITDNGSTVINVTATDPDGEGPQDMEIDAPIDLNTEKEYELQILLANTLSLQPINISAEVAEEGTDHMFFFSWTDGIFSNPTGNGNIDDRADEVDYVGENATDENGQPLGLTTQWTTSPSPLSGQFRVMLKHQPGLKSSTSSSAVGETDIDVTFEIIIH